MLTTHCTESSASPRSALMDGNAMTTIVMPRTSTNCAMHSSASTSDRRRGSITASHTRWRAPGSRARRLDGGASGLRSLGIGRGAQLLEAHDVPARAPESVGNLVHDDPDTQRVLLRQPGRVADQRGELVDQAGPAALAQRPDRNRHVDDELALLR